MIASKRATLSHSCQARTRFAAAIGVLAMLAGCADTPRSEAPRVDAAPSTQAIKAVPRKPGDLVTVSIYEFRSAVTEIPARGATDMFMTALVNGGQFRVVERARVNEGAIREKQLNAGDGFFAAVVQAG